MKYKTTNGVEVVISGKTGDTWKTDTNKLNIAMFER